MERKELFLTNLEMLSRRCTSRTDGYKVMVISGPGGVGKGTIIEELLRRYAPHLYFSVSCTTRKKRANEFDGIHYNFMNPMQFTALKEADGFFEAKVVHNHWYGTPRAPIIEALENGKFVIIECDVEGSKEIRKLMPNACFIFLTTDYETLKQRLTVRRRDTREDADAAAIRLKNSWDEVEKARTLFTDGEHIQSSTFDNVQDAVTFDTDQVILRLEKHAARYWVPAPATTETTQAYA